MGRGKGLTRRKVIDAAIQVARDEGVNAVTMRRVGRQLGVEAMSLYTWVKGKQDLLDAMRAQAPDLAAALTARAASGADGEAAR